ncbi:MAG: NAD(P)-binding protein [Anaerolineae bacterium]|nr:NAD(P)-binding protein [Anaerolineae bacterium]
MSEIGTASQPLRVAIVGSGPAGFYAAEHLLKQKELNLQVDMFDRLPTPFGLVRGGVAPDHQKIKSVTAVYEKIAKNPAFRFFGYVELGKDLQLSDLWQFYHQVVLTTGAQTDKPTPGAGRRPGQQPRRHRICGLVQRPPRLPRSALRPQPGKRRGDWGGQCGHRRGAHPVPFSG